MFEHVAPGYYGLLYGMKSGFAHGGIESTIFRALKETPDAVQGCRFDIKDCMSVGNIAVPIARGYLSVFDVAFPGSVFPADLAAQRDRAAQRLDEYMDCHWSENADARGWMRAIAPLAGWTVRADSPT